MKHGDKVRCIMADERFGLMEGVVYTVNSVANSACVNLVEIPIYHFLPIRFEMVSEANSAIMSEEEYDHWNRLEMTAHTLSEKVESARPYKTADVKKLIDRLQLMLDTRALYHAQSDRLIEDKRTIEI